jgi:hypothetical protein
MNLIAAPTQAAAKTYVEISAEASYSGWATLWGALFGVMFSALGTVAIFNWTGFVRYCIALPMVAIGYWVLFGAIGSTEIAYSGRGLVLSYRLFGWFPVFRRTLVRQEDVLGFRHISRERSYLTQDGAQLDEHFIVVATRHPKEYVVKNLGRLSTEQASSARVLAQQWANQHGLPLTHELDAKPNLASHI